MSVQQGSAGEEQVHTLRSHASQDSFDLLGDIHPAYAGLSIQQLEHEASENHFGGRSCTSSAT
jgi:hypothetical protein